MDKLDHIDKLDQINVSLGHDAGDYVIRKTADIIKLQFGIYHRLYMGSHAT